MIGRRLPDGHENFQPGDYGRLRQVDGTWIWYARPPIGGLGNLSKHTVVEHEDGTITVTPSILIYPSGEPGWHGYLERGVWRSC